MLTWGWAVTYGREKVIFAASAEGAGLALL
jgi:hypothetical protein